MSEAPVRSFRLTFRLDADTREDLASALFNMATAVDRNELTIGVSGGCHSGYVYELLHDPNQTHESYFVALNAHLNSKKASP